MDALVVGGGVMGCASALALADRGVEVRLLERSVPGAEASSAAAGILGAQVEARRDDPFTRLCLASRARYRGFVERLFELTGIDVGFRPCGVVQLARDEASLEALARDVAWQRDAGERVEVLDARTLRETEPAISEAFRGAVRFVGDGRVDPPALMRALRIAAGRRGVAFETGSVVRRVEIADGRAIGVRLDDGGVRRADRVVLAAGSWTALVPGAALPEGSVRPARGQIVELRTSLPCVRGVVYGPHGYLSPRDDGRVLVGSTLEFVGFRREVTARAVRDLLAAAIEIAPELAEAEVGRAWSSFRPHTDDGLPLLGPASVANLVLATGHFRNGILLAPITAEIVASLVLDEAPPVDVAPFAASRLVAAAGEPSRPGADPGGSAGPGRRS